MKSTGARSSNELQGLDNDYMAGYQDVNSSNCHQGGMPYHHLITPSLQTLLPGNKEREQHNVVWSQDEHEGAEQQFDPEQPPNHTIHAKLST